MTDAELKQYLEYILGTTFLLDDGTRLKTVYIPWKDLTPSQCLLTLNAIKKVVITELKELKTATRLRLEFNEIPDELDEMLANISGRESKELEWVQVDMD
jgi:hypothetical protein